MTNSIPLYMELYYRLTVSSEVPYPNETVTELQCDESAGSIALVSGRYMMDADGKQNENKILYMTFRTPASPDLVIPPLMYETMTITFTEFDTIQSIANYVDFGNTQQTEKDVQDFVVTAANGVFETASLVRVFYDNVNLTRKVVIMNDAYMNVKPTYFEKDNSKMDLYYSIVLNKYNPIPNNNVLSISNNTPAISYSVVSNRYMQNKNGQKNNNILTYLTFRIGGSSELLIPTLLYETMIIVTPDNGTIQSSAVYQDDGVDSTTNKLFQDFAVNGSSGIFIGAKNVRVYYDNENLTRKVQITNYYPDNDGNPINQNLTLYKNVNTLSEPFMTLYYGTVLSPEVPIVNYTMIDTITYSQSRCYSGVTTRRMITEDWQETDKLATFLITRTPTNLELLFPPLNNPYMNITAANGDYLIASTFFIDAGAGFVSTGSRAILAVIAATGMFAPAKTAIIVIQNALRRRVVELYA